MSLVLLVGAALFARSLSKLQHIDLKLEAKNRYIVHINPQAAGYSQRQVGDLYRMIENQFHAVPGVEKVGISTYTPMEDNNDGWGVQVQGQPDLHVSASDVKANAEYFDSVGTHVLMGRGIRLQDTAASTTVAVVNQSFVNKLFKPGENPIGHHFGTDPESTGDYEIVGMVEDTAYTNARWKDHAMYFVPMMQRPASDTGPIEKDEMMYAGAGGAQNYRGPMNDMETITRKTLSGINPNLSVVKFQTFDAQIADLFTEDRMLARLTMLFGVLALLLATLGLSGVTAYAVARRTSEIGIRMALGAKRAEGDRNGDAERDHPGSPGARNWCSGRAALRAACRGAALRSQRCRCGRAFDLCRDPDPGRLLRGLYSGTRAASIDPARALRNQ